MGLVRCCKYLFYEQNPIISEFKRGRFFINLIQTPHLVREAIPTRISDEKKQMQLRARIQRRFPPHIGRFLL